MLPKTSSYAKTYDGQTKQMNFMIEDHDLKKKKKKKICKKLGAYIKK